MEGVLTQILGLIKIYLIALVDLIGVFSFIGSGTLLTVSALATFTRVHRETLDHIDRESQRFHSNPRSMGTAHGDMIHGPRNTNPGPLRRCTNCVCL